MNSHTLFASRAAALAAAALLASGCGGEASEEPAVNAAEAGTTLDQPENDASALESAVIDPAPAPPLNAADGEGGENENAPVLGETSGGDTGGNTAGSDVDGM